MLHGFTFVCIHFTFKEFVGWPHPGRSRTDKDSRDDLQVSKDLWVYLDFDDADAATHALHMHGVAVEELGRNIKVAINNKTLTNFQGCNQQ